MFIFVIVKWAGTVQLLFTLQLKQLVKITYWIIKTFNLKNYEDDKPHLPPFNPRLVLLGLFYCFGWDYRNQIDAKATSHCYQIRRNDECILYFNFSQANGNLGLITIKLFSWAWASLQCSGLIKVFFPSISCRITMTTAQLLWTQKRKRKKRGLFGRQAYSIICIKGKYAKT